jgi:hypothetical protein
MSDNPQNPSITASADRISRVQRTPAQEIDVEDRRWQLEWARRNIED